LNDQLKIKRVKLEENLKNLRQFIYDLNEMNNWINILHSTSTDLPVTSLVSSSIDFNVSLILFINII
jgi:hypothetical protein